MEKIISEIAFFLFFLIFICFLPGRAFLYFKKIDLSIIETFTVANILGLFLFTVLNFFSQISGLVNLSYFTVFALDAIFIFNRLRHPMGITVFLRPKWTTANMIFLGFLGLGILSQIYLRKNFELWTLLVPLFLGLSVFTLTRRLFHTEVPAAGAAFISYLIMDLLSVI